MFLFVIRPFVLVQNLSGEFRSPLSLIKLLGWKAYVLFKLMPIVLILCSNMLYYLTMHALHGVLCSSLTLVPSGPVFLGSVLQYHTGLLPVLVPGHCVETIECCVLCDICVRLEAVLYCK